MSKHDIDASASPPSLSEPSPSSHPLQQLPAGAVASLRDRDFDPADVATLVAHVAPAPCVWCGDVDCDRRFDHARDHAAAESTWRELAGGAR